MLIHKIKTNTGYVIKYTRENWTEWLVVIYAIYLKDEGERMPRFYLPVRRCDTRHAYECWIFPLAPFVLLWILTYRAFIGIWRDLLDVSLMFKEKNDLIK